MMITFVPYADIPASPVTTTTAKDAKDFISNTYAELPALPAGKDPSQLAVVKAYQSRATAQAKKPLKCPKCQILLISTSLQGYSSRPKQVDDMAATGKVLKAISTQEDQLATVVTGSDLTAEDMEFYGDVGPSVSMVPEAGMHLQELANMFTCNMCTLGDITLTPGTVTPTATGPTIGADKCADLTVTCANPGGTVFMQFNVDEGGPAIGETVTAVLDCVNGKWVYAPADQPSRPITE
ncbi:Protein C30G12.4, partial [Aphelenchoides avenae]